MYIFFISFLSVFYQFFCHLAFYYLLITRDVFFTPLQYFVSLLLDLNTVKNIINLH